METVETENLEDKYRALAERKELDFEPRFFCIRAFISFVLLFQTC